MSDAAGGSRKVRTKNWSFSYHHGITRPREEQFCCSGLRVKYGLNRFVQNEQRGTGVSKNRQDFVCE